jgi:hypothetical protein
MRSAQDLVMRNVGLKLEEKLFVFGIIVRFFVVFACEALDRIVGVPKRDQRELGFGIPHPAQNPDATIAGSSGVIL